ncbi:MAG: hypothetical protein JNN26_20510 [Candidatus Obscuribacter sp.]|nr:hypothetical protein [Candidatus Obscuribacter sp.]
MPNLKLISLFCKDQEDDTGPDEPYLIIDGKKIDCSPMSEGDTRNLSQVGVFPFDGNIVVRLWDEDWPDSDDDLGTYTIKAPEQLDPERELEAQFKRDDAEYYLRYKVLA